MTLNTHGTDSLDPGGWCALTASPSAGNDIDATHCFQSHGPGRLGSASQSGDVRRGLEVFVAEKTYSSSLWIIYGIARYCRWLSGRRLFCSARIVVSGSVAPKVLLVPAAQSP